MITKLAKGFKSETSAQTPDVVTLPQSVPLHYNLDSIQMLLTEAFTNKQLRRLCVDVPDFAVVREKLGSRTPKARIVQLLVEYAVQNSKVEALLSLAEKHAPAIYKK
jgi:hypothetical protein